MKLSYSLFIRVIFMDYLLVTTTFYYTIKPRKQSLYELPKHISFVSYLKLFVVSRAWPICCNSYNPVSVQISSNEPKKMAKDFFFTFNNGINNRHFLWIVMTSQIFSFLVTFILLRLNVLCNLCRCSCLHR